MAFRRKPAGLQLKTRYGLRAVAHDDEPLPHLPTAHNLVGNIRIGRGEGLGGLAGGEDKDRAIGGVGEGAGLRQLAAMVKIGNQFEMLGTKGSATLNVFRTCVVDE